VKSYVRNTINPSFAKILLTSVIKRFSAPHNHFVFLKVLSDVDVLSVSNV